jgi:hypothetical protein
MISSNPYHPLSVYSGNYSHMDGESWMVDGEASVMMMAMISSNSPSRQGARTEFLVPNHVFWWWRCSGILSGKMSNPSVFLGQRLYLCGRRARGDG